MRSIVFIFIFFIGCADKKPSKEKLTSEVHCFSTFVFGSRSDTIRHYGVSSYLFDNDSLTILRIDKNYNWKVEKINLTQQEILTLNTLINRIDFLSYSGNNIHQEMIKNGTMYCGAHYGYIDSLGNVEVFVPFGKEKLINTLVTILFHKKAFYTSDTTEIINYTNAIKRKYLKVYPHIQPIEFVPPITN